MSVGVAQLRVCRSPMALDVHTVSGQTNDPRLTLASLIPCSVQRRCGGQPQGGEVRTVLLVAAGRPARAGQSRGHPHSRSSGRRENQPRLFQLHQGDTEEASCCGNSPAEQFDRFEILLKSMRLFTPSEKNYYLSAVMSKCWRCKKANS